MRRPPATQLCILFSFITGTGAALTYVPMNDADLLAQSPAVVVGRVLDSNADPATGSTLTRIAIDEVLKGGEGLGSPLVVRVPGFVEGPRARLVPGAPRFATGERVILFVSPRSDGTWGIQQFMLGAFHSAAEGRLAVRDLAGARAVGGGATDSARDFPRFRRWIRERARGVEAKADYLVANAPGSIRSVPSDFVLLGHSRWQIFDAAGSVGWEFQSAGYDGAGAGSSGFAVGRAAWNAAPNSSVSYTSAGTTASTGPGLTAADGHNRIIFGDPNNEISGSFSCGSGGVLAIGGYATSGTHSHNGDSFGTIVEGDIVVQDGTSCFFAGSPGRDEDVFCHELGHTLGLGHSPDSGAIMFASSQPPYAATLGADDLAGICFLYGSNCPGASPPNAPSNLAAAPLSASQITLTWNDNSNDESSFRVEARTGGGAFGEIGSVAANTTSATVSSLQSDTPYDFRVRARNGSGDSPYSNTASATTLPGGALPGAPSGLTATPLSTTSIRLQWQDNSGDETSFRVERQVGFSFVDIGGVGPNATIVDVLGLSPNTLYTFQVKARNGVGDSPPSNTASATTLPVAQSAPQAPAGLQANATGPSTVHLTWIDNSADEESFRIEWRSGGGSFTEVANVAAGATSVDVQGLAPATAHDFRVRARNAAGDSPYSNIASATTPPACGDANSVCLQGGRFAVRIDWKTPDGQTGVGHPVQLTADSAYFWFFLPGNIEIVAKVLDGCGISDRYWVFATGLTNVETHITVTDTLTAQVKTYDNLQGQAFQPIQDTGAFPTCAAAGARIASPAASSSPELSAVPLASGCQPGPQTLCLGNGRFKLEVLWATPLGSTGQGQAETLTSDSGYFWFFDSSNIELVVKVLDACQAFGRYWVFAGGLTNVEVRLIVTDTQTGAVRQYFNPINNPYPPLQDADAFATCP